MRFTKNSDAVGTNLPIMCPCRGNRLLKTRSIVFLCSHVLETTDWAPASSRFIIIGGIIILDSQLVEYRS